MKNIQIPLRLDLLCQGITPTRVEYLPESLKNDGMKAKGRIAKKIFYAPQQHIINLLLINQALSSFRDPASRSLHIPHPNSQFLEEYGWHSPYYQELIEQFEFQGETCHHINNNLCVSFSLTLFYPTKQVFSYLKQS
jgi:retron-type reverse transcriptase